MLKLRQALWIGVAVLCVVFSRAEAANDTTKRTLKGNMTEVYNRVPEEAPNFGEMFSRGIFYGRIRLNGFRWEWSDEIPGPCASGVPCAILAPPSHSRSPRFAPRAPRFSHDQGRVPVADPSGDSRHPAAPAP